MVGSAEELIRRYLGTQPSTFDALNEKCLRSRPSPSAYIHGFKS